MQVFDQLIIFNDEEILDLIIGKEDGLLFLLKKNKYWDDLLEQLGVYTDQFHHLEDFEEAYNSCSENFIKIQIFRNLKLK